MRSSGVFVLGSLALVLVVSLGIASRPVPPKASALVFLRSDSLASQAAADDIGRLAAKFAPEGIEFRGFFPHSGDTRKSAQWFGALYGMAFPVEVDLFGREAKRLGITKVPTVVLLDSAGTELFRVPLDSTGIGSFEGALKALAADVQIPPPSTVAPGDSFAPSEPMPSLPTYGNAVRGILANRCVRCHKPGGVAPFSLEGYEAARKWAPMIEAVVRSRKMPPWKAVPGFGEFRDDWSLSEAEIESLVQWHAAGTPEGSEAAQGEPPRPSTSLGTPDLVLRPKATYRLPALGKDLYRYFVLDHKFEQTTYVRAVEIRPGNRRVVHHVVPFVDGEGIAAMMEAQNDDGKSGFGKNPYPDFIPYLALGLWVPGTLTRELPEGMAYEIRPGSTIVLQIHYATTGIEEEDLTELALYFAKEKPKVLMRAGGHMSGGPPIPAGEPRFLKKESFPVVEDMTVYAVWPHMHLTGKWMKVEIADPNGNRTPLILVDDWDFGWQLFYWLKRPLPVKAGSRIEVEAMYDNSEGNPMNPFKPPKPMRWGERTNTEMCVVGLMYADGIGPLPPAEKNFARPQPSKRLEE